MVQALGERALVNGVNLAYQVAGSGTPVVFHHGLGIGSAVWIHQMQHLVDVCQVITYDARGVGDSDKPKGGYEVPTLAADLIGLLDHLGLERAVVCGVSQGGRVALYATLEYPRRVRGLVVCDTTCDAASPEERKRLSELAELARTRGLEAAVDSWLSGSPWLQPFFKHFIEHGFLRDERPPKEWARGQALRSTADAFAGYLEGIMNRPDLSGRLREVRVPVLVVVGSQDGPPYLKSADYMAATFRDVNQLVLEGAGHLAPLERAEEFNTVLQDYLEGLQGAAFDPYLD